jgi:hypothetical protein
MHIGIQDADTTTGFPVRPDGTFDVHAVVTTAADTSPTLTTINSFCGVTPTTGTKTIAHGALIAVRIQLVTVGTTPAASVAFIGSASPFGAAMARPTVVNNTSGSWVSGGTLSPLLLVASDGTFGTIEGINTVGQFTTVAFDDSDNPDEYGNVFQVPFTCKAKSILFTGTVLTATGDLQFDITSTPLGTPASMIGGPITVPAESLGGVTSSCAELPLTTIPTFSPGVDYCVSVKATAAGNVGMYGLTLPAAGARALLRGGTTTFGATRNGGSGAFTTSSTVLRAIAVVLHEVETGGGGTHFSVGG